MLELVYPVHNIPSSLLQFSGGRLPLVGLFAAVETHTLSLRFDALRTYRSPNFLAV
ncbi:hypothetical protein Hdeb2414_s0010g00340481 [Helianthus debilis subsp. tardiflorus]